MRAVILVTFFLIAAAANAQEEKKGPVQIGNDFYRQGQYDKAAAEYEKALAEKSDNTTKFNLASATYRQGKTEEAKKAFAEISTTEKEPELQSKSYYNQGAILSKEKKLEESIEAYKNALRKNPDDRQARENLQKALLELKKKNPPKPKEDQQKKQQKQKQPQPRMNQKEAEQRLKLLEQKEKEVQQRLQKEKSKSGGGQAKDW
jgi:Ca-activated chloride channel family protein